MPQCWSFNRNTKLWLAVSPHRNPLSELEKIFHLNGKEWATTSVVREPSLCIPCAASDLLLGSLEKGAPLPLHVCWKV